MTPTSLRGAFVIVGVTLLCCEAARWWGVRTGIVRPRLFGPTRGRLVSGLGGLSLLAGSLFGFAWFFTNRPPDAYPADYLRDPAQMQSLIAGVLAAGAVLYAEGYYSDRRGRSHPRTAVAYVAAAAVLCLSGFVVDHVSLGDRQLQFGLLAIPFTLLYVGALLLFFRSLDGLDGLPTGLAALILCVQLYLLRGGEEGLATEFCAIAALVLLASFAYEVYPVRLALGRNGHSLPGLLVAASTILTRQKTFVAAALFFPAAVVVVVLGLVALQILEKRLLFGERRLK